MKQKKAAQPVKVKYKGGGKITVGKLTKMKKGGSCRPTLLNKISKSK